MSRTHGPDVTLLRFCTAQDVPASQSYLTFASWGELRKAADLTRHANRRGQGAVHTRQSLLEALAGVVKQTGPDVTVAQFSRHTGISQQPVVRVFGSWKVMRQAGGLPDVTSPASRREYQRRELLALLKIVSRRRPYITQLEFCLENDLSTSMVSKIGPWTALRREAGLSLRGSVYKAYWYEQHKDLLPPPGDVFNGQPVPPA